MFRVFAFIFALLLFAGCDSKPVFKNVDITGASYGKDFTLTDHHGQIRHLADFRGKVVVVFFGFTQCPDICPTTMTEWAAVMQKLGKESEHVQVLFITMDPERDTPEILAKYVPSFNPTFIGLFGDIPTTIKVAKNFNVYYEKIPGKTPSTYTMSHTAGSYIYDTHGRLRLFVRPGQEGLEALESDLHQLFKESI